MLIFLFFAIKDDETAAEKFIDAALANLHTATSPNKVSLDRKNRIQKFRLKEIGFRYPDPHWSRLRRPWGCFGQSLHSHQSPRVSLDRKKQDCEIRILIDSVDPDPDWEDQWGCFGQSLHGHQSPRVSLDRKKQDCWIRIRLRSVDPDPGVETAAISLENGHVNIFNNALSPTFSPHSGCRQSPQAN